MKKTPWIIISLCLTLVVVLAFKHASILYAVEKFLVIDEEPEKVDVIVVLGGGPGRVEYGVSLYQSGFANKILLSVDSCDWKTTVSYLGVPDDDILVEDQSRSTYENAKYSLEIMEAKKFKSAILVTSPYHTRRASMIFDRIFKDIELTICPVPSYPYGACKWWQNSSRVKVIASEYLKLVWNYLFAR